MATSQWLAWLHTFVSIRFEYLPVCNDTAQSLMGTLGRPIKVKPQTIVTCMSVIAVLYYKPEQRDVYSVSLLFTPLVTATPLPELITICTS